MDKEKLRWARIALMIGAAFLLIWVATGGNDENAGTFNAVSGALAGIGLIAALGLVIGARRSSG